MRQILLLGPGKSGFRIGRATPIGEGEAVTVLDRNDDVLAFWDKATPVKHDLRFMPLPLPDATFDEIHAYEILNLIPGTADQFYALWGELHRVLAPGGVVFGKTPHWRSRYIYAYPGQQRVYTPELLAYLTNDPLGSKEDFSFPYRFKIEMMQEPQDLAFAFALRKV